LAAAVTADARDVRSLDSATLRVGQVNRTHPLMPKGKKTVAANGTKQSAPAKPYTA
jgi:hypothetical protein